MAKYAINTVITANSDKEALAILKLTVPDAREHQVVQIAHEKGAGGVPTGKQKFLVHYFSAASAEQTARTQITVNVDPVAGVHGAIDVA